MKREDPGSPEIDWRMSVKDALTAPDRGSREAYKLRRLALRYFIEGNILFWKGFNREPLRCLSDTEAQKAL
ncbi:hypothetical protein L484_004992 [Morus notabilis]|uniref:Uncharacterized protein n=1 Tax=Morus notabilis TaxID=981085 RepID=W9SV56_9ROSA|nr:hypothetical protein L484_004992 [Morus notabilis]